MCHIYTSAVPSKVKKNIYQNSKSPWFEESFRESTTKRFPKIRIIQSFPPSMIVWICFNFFFFLNILLSTVHPQPSDAQNVMVNSYLNNTKISFYQTCWKLQVNACEARETKYYKFMEGLKHISNSQVSMSLKIRLKLSTLSKQSLQPNRFIKCY